MSVTRVDSPGLPLSAIPLCQLLPCHLGPLKPKLSINLYVKCCLDCTIGVFHMYQLSLTFRMRSRSSMSSHASSSLGLVVTMSWGLTLQIWVIALFCCRCWWFGFVSGQVSLEHCTLHTILYTWPSVLKERWWEERTGSSSLNFFQAVFTPVVIESSQPSAAENMSPR